MPISKLKPTYSLTEDRLAELKQVVPEAFADGKVNWEALRELLGEHLEDEGQDTERFGLFWPGKRLARRAAVQPPQMALLPSPGEGVNEATTRHIFIEGENLEVLKLLRKAYAGKIKMIYIDPPYNTGNDFIYPDDYAEPVEAYLRRTGQTGEVGELLTSNPKSSGRFHSTWLDMMYPRLVLAREMLAHDGLLVVSIDDQEVTHLRLVLDETFGAENFLCQVVWKNKYGPGAATKGFGSLHEYVLCYSKSTLDSVEGLLSPEDIAKYRRRDARFSVRGGYITQPLATRSKDDRPNLVYPIEWQDQTIWPDKQWIWSRDRMEAALANDEVVIREKEGKFSVRFKQYLRDEGGRMRRAKPLSLMLGPFNQKGTREMHALFAERVFDFPKPSGLVKHFFSLIVDGDESDNGVFMDFFAGSCTAADAVLQLNHEDNGSRRFIMAQFPEPTGRDDHPTIAEIGKERIRRAIARMQQEQEGKLDLEAGDEREDLGFRVYKLGRSQLKRWQPHPGESTQEVQARFAQFESPLAEGWDREALPVEVMLQEGFPLDSRVERLGEVDGNTVDCVTSDWCEHRLFLCLDEVLAEETVDRLPGLMGDQDILVCLDSALTDESKMQLDDRCNVHVI